MLDIALIREKPEWVIEQVSLLNDTAPIAEILAADKKRREIIQEEETLRQERNASSKSIGRLIGQQKKLDKEISQLQKEPGNIQTVQRHPVPKTSQKTRTQASEGETSSLQ